VADAERRAGDTLAGEAGRNTAVKGTGGKALPFDEEAKLVYGVVLSLRNMVKKLTGSCVLFPFFPLSRSPPPSRLIEGLAIELIPHLRLLLYGDVTDRFKTSKPTRPPPTPCTCSSRQQASSSSSSPPQASTARSSGPLYALCGVPMGRMVSGWWRTQKRTRREE
jgi:hypothetical protein